MFKGKWAAMCAATIVVVFAACGGDAQQDTQPGQPAGPQQQIGANVDLPEGVTLEMVQQGKSVFETTTCFTCHAMDASGTALAPSLRDQEWLNSDGSFEGIAEIIRVGVMQPVRYPGAMPAMGGAQLNQDQIRQLAAYIYAISHGG
jgi:mono/diheme cytochrome c family protein